MLPADLSPNKALFKRFHDAMNSDDLAVISQTIDEIVDPEVVIRTPLPVRGTGAQALKEVMEILLRSYPDLHCEIQDLIEEGDKVVGRTVVTGTNEGEYMGRPATGRAVTYNEIFIFRFDDGRIVETWGVVDVLAQMKQLGLFPA